MLISRTQNEAIIDAIRNLTEFDNWSTKTIRIFYDEDEKRWCVDTEETYEDED